MSMRQVVASVAVMRDGRIVSGSSDDTIRVWNIESGEPSADWTHRSEYVR